MMLWFVDFNFGLVATSRLIKAHSITPGSSLLRVCLFFLPALFHVLGVPVSGELNAGFVHDNVTESHADHVVVVYGADADALQVCERHQQILPAHGAAVGMLPVILTRE